MALSDLLFLEPAVQHYAWGDTRFIPDLLGIENPDKKPYAELWMGAHPDLPSKVVVGGVLVPLNSWIESAPETILGAQVSAAFSGQLPFLFKVLSAEKPLSIQVHPAQDQARAGFARENAAGIPRSALERNYKDDNHKPELILALTDFHALRGFRPLDEIARIPHDVPEVAELWSDFKPDAPSLRACYERCMTLAQQEVDAILSLLIARLTTSDQAKAFGRHERESWVLRADREFSRDGHHDRGLFSLLLLNLVHLKPGEAMYLPAGILHAYLEGSGLEIMANSNNVLRGGLTSKHVDVAELLENVVFEGGEPEILRGVPLPGTEQWTYKTPAREFELRRIELNASRPYHSDPDHSAEILILIEARENACVLVSSPRHTLQIRRGNSVFASYGVSYTISATGETTLYKATIPPARCA